MQPAWVVNCLFRLLCVCYTVRHTCTLSPLKLMIKWSHSSTAPHWLLQIRGYYYKLSNKERGGGVCRPDEHLLLFSSPFIHAPSSPPSFFHDLPPAPFACVECVHLCVFVLRAFGIPRGSLEFRSFSNYGSLAVTLSVSNMWVSFQQSNNLFIKSLHLFVIKSPYYTNKLNKSKMCWTNGETCAAKIGKIIKKVKPERLLLKR